MTLNEFLLANYRLENDRVLGSRGQIVGTGMSNGYLGTGVVFEGRWRRVLMHRLVFLLGHGFLPKMIDHINGDRTDNRLSNLREATKRGNQANRKAASASSFKGVYVRTKRYARPRFEASCDGKYLGVFDTAEEAAAMYNAKALEVFGEFARLNKLETA